MSDDRNYYITEGISQDAIKEAATRNILKNPDALIVIHFHAYESDDGIPACNEVCYRVVPPVADDGQVI